MGRSKRPDASRASEQTFGPELANARIVEFPLRGEWAASNTPAERIPSHGTDYFGQRYAYDFYRLTEDGMKPYSAPIARHLFASIPAEACLCWDEPVLSAFPGVVIDARDGWPDRRKLNLVLDLLQATFIGAEPRDGDFRPLTGNYVLVEGDPGVAMYGHLREGSVRVRAGDPVTTGQQLGTVGNSGNSSMPHLHFQLQSGPDPRTATGLPCAFRSYERFREGAWEQVTNGFPDRLERIRVHVL